MLDDPATPDWIGAWACLVRRGASVTGVVVLVVCLTGSVACLRSGFELPGSDHRSPPAEAGHPDARRPDVRPADDSLDAPLTDGRLADGPTASLACTSPSVVGTNPPGPLIEPIVRWSRLQVVARLPSSGGSQYLASRSTLAAPFGRWRTTSSFRKMEDGSTFSLLGAEMAMVSVPGSPTGRKLMLCMAPFTSNACLPQPVRDKTTNAMINADLDGPSVAKVGGALVMAINVLSGSGPPRVLLAEPIAPTDLSRGWLAQPVPPVINALGGIDDPALSPDATIIVLAADGGDLWVSRRKTASAPFGTPTFLSGVNSSADDGSPYLVSAPAQKLELFFSSKRSGKSLIYRSLCTP